VRNPHLLEATELKNVMTLRYRLSAFIREGEMKVSLNRACHDVLIRDDGRNMNLSRHGEPKEESGASPDLANFRFALYANRAVGQLF
jgi:hypothetical protein